MSRTIQEPATVERAHTSNGNPRSSVTRLLDTGRNNGRVSIGTGNSSGISTLLIALRLLAKTRRGEVRDRSGTRTAVVKRTQVEALVFAGRLEGVSRPATTYR